MSDQISTEKNFGIQADDQPRKSALRLTHRLFGGFLTMVLLLVLAISATIFMVDGIKNSTDRIVNLRTPTALASTKLTTDIQGTLATLRGFMLTGKDSFKVERAALWQSIDGLEAQLTDASKNWTNPANVAAWGEFRTMLADFRVAQEKVEAIAHSPEEQPALQILKTEAAPRAAIMVSTITQMIDLELANANADRLGGDRVQILGQMADVRGTLGIGLANIRAYLLTGDIQYVEAFNGLWLKNGNRFADLQASARFLSAEQQRLLQDFAGTRAEFEPLPEMMFEIRGSDQWNMAAYTLVTEAAPLANSLLTMLVGAKNEDGTRTGGMVDNQRELLTNDNNNNSNATNSLLIAQWSLLVIGLIVGGVISMLTVRAIVKPLVGMTDAMTKLADNDLEVVVPAQDRGDEIGDMAAAVEVFKQNAIEVARLNLEGEANTATARERAKAMNSLVVELGSVVDATVKGDFSKRINGEFKDDDLRGVALSVNDLVETVDAGISETGEVLSALADMDLTQRVNGEYQGAFLKLKDDTNAVADKLSDVVGQLRETSRGVKSATGEILAGANDLSERTTKQAATIEETSAAMEQLATTVMENVQKAQDASSSSQEVSKTAEEGADVMHQANEAMGRITSSSAKISNIIGMIDDIAFQTNLLALNASVEAARAGEAGKGFAVVAIEVRRLAQSAADASSEVKQLIEQSSTEVDGGSKLVSSAAEKLTSMLEAARKSNALMDSIANESREQASAIDEVNVAVRQMDEMTQHNAALVEETNAAIEQTEAQASELDRIVEVFKISNADTQGSVRTAA